MRLPSNYHGNTYCSSCKELTMEKKLPMHGVNCLAQATVRRHKVVQSILELKRLGHRAYMRCDEQMVNEKALKLPEHG
eukprot:9692358-Karenia_brevis.AAC.1